MRLQISEKSKGIFFILLSAFCFSMMSVFIRLSGDNIPVMEKAFFRNSIAAIIAWNIVIRHKQPIRVGKRNLPTVLMRSICGTVGIVCNFYATSHLNISDANLLNKLSPFFAILFSIFILKEKASKWEWLTVVVAFSGALLVIKPGFSMDTFPAFIGFLGGFGAGMAYTFLRKASKNGVPGPVNVMYFSTFSTLVMLPSFILNFQPVTSLQLVFLLCIGLAAAGGQLSITAAYSHAAAKDISVFDYMQVIFAAIWGFFLFDQVPDGWSIVGYVVILGAAVVRFIHGKMKDK